MLQSFGIHDFGAFLLGVLAITLIPGPNSLYVLTTGIRASARGCVLAILAVVAGECSVTLLSLAGLASLLKAYPFLYESVSCAGAAYLAWLGIKMIRSSLARRAAGAEAPAPAAAPQSSAATFRSGLLISLLNPKSYIFSVAFFTQFVNPAAPGGWTAALILLAVVETISALYLSVLCLGGRGLLRRAASMPRLCRLGKASTGSLFMVFAAELLMN